ncbi:hypothetical protein [Janthinobacterium sp. 17J80-10]|uniref:hypothetical protein n=1 Tax=Janthinobacterium sp. 17J80-10 TaxID=2497863 RepID=UPI0010058EB0|nr:hypothetical protein [Janthinobacterium sp. 17J80-10]QAU32739.1 hypothetical protein EKL02_00340 [Janthinobacterium sp. 17J80-10]
MHSTFQASDSGQAVIQNATAIGHEKLVVTLQTEGSSSLEFQIREDTGSQDVVSSSITINQECLQALVQWLRQQGAVD